MAKERSDWILLGKHTTINSSSLYLQCVDFFQNPSIPFICFLAGSFYPFRIVVASFLAGLAGKESWAGSGDIRALW